MNIKNKTYQNIMKTFKKDITLNLLDTVEKSSDITQIKISAKLGIAVGLANSYLKRCVNKGWVKVKNIPIRRYGYYLTPKGFAIKSKLTAEYLYSSFNYFRETRKEFEEIIKVCKRKGFKKILLLGDGDLTEIAILFLTNHKLNHIQITNLKLNKQNLKKGRFDCIWITEIYKPQKIFDFLKKEKISENTIFYPKILGIKNG